LALITPTSLRQPAQQRTTMVGENLDVFTKRVLVDRHIVVSCVKFQGSHAPLCPCYCSTYMYVISCCCALLLVNFNFWMPDLMDVFKLYQLASTLLCLYIKARHARGSGSKSDAKIRYHFSLVLERKWS